MSFKVAVNWGLFLGPLLLLSIGCNNSEEGPEISSIDQSNSAEEIRLSPSASIQKAEKAAELEQLDSATFWYQKAAVAYAQQEQWDSMYENAILEAFYLGNEAHDYRPLKVLLTESDTFAERAPDTIKANVFELSGYIEYAKGHMIEALPYYQKMSVIWGKYPPSSMLAGCYNMLGIIYNRLEDYPLSEQYYRVGIKLNEQLRDTLGKRKATFNLGLVLNSQNRWQEAIESFRQSKETMAVNDGAIDGFIAQSYLLGQQPQKALPLAKKALQKAQQFEGRKRMSIAEGHQILADTYLELKDMDNAILQYQQMLDLLLEDYGPTHRELAKGYLFLANAYRQKDLWNLALQAYQQSITTFLPAFKPARVEEGPAPDSLFSREGYLMEALRGKGQVLQGRYMASKDIEDLKAASKHFDVAVQYINQIKTLHTESEAKAFYSEHYSVPYCEEAIATHLILHEVTGKEEHLLQAYRLARQSTAFLLRESVNEERAARIGNVPLDTIAVLEKINGQISNLQSALAEVVETSSVGDSLNSILLKRKEERIAFMDELKGAYPLYYQLKHNLQATPLKVLQEELDSETLVINYFVGDKTIYSFAFDQQQIQVSETPIDSTFYESVDQFRQALTDLDYIRNNSAQAEKQFVQSSRSLYEKLLAETLQAYADKGLKKLLIVPNGVINYLPFECFLKQPTTNWLDTEAFLIHDYAIRYAYYADLLLIKDNEKIGSRFLGFGTEYNDQTLDALNVTAQDSIQNPQLKDAVRGKNLSKLLFADDEVAEVADLVAGKSFVNEEATKTNFMTYSPDFEVLHIATHSFLDDQNDSTAYIAFHQNDASEDFLLSLAEIYSMDLRANLVALSSCQTNIGAIRRGEGVMSLARAFNIAGSESVIASQWSVSDRSSYAIMKTFYAHLKNGLPKDKALRKAKLDYLIDDQASSPAYRIPAFWAPIILIGSEEAIVFEATSPKWWYWLGGLGVLIAILFLYRKIQS